MGKVGGFLRIAFATIAIVAGLATGARAQSTWVTVSAADNTFHYVAPSEPTVTPKDAMEGDVPYTITTYVSVSNGFGVIGAYTVYHADNVAADADLVLGGFLKGLKAELVSSTPMPYQRGTSDTLKGLLASAKSDSLTCHIRVVVDGVKIYTLAACGMKGNDATADIDRVIGSFSITKP